MEDLLINKSSRSYWDSVWQSSSTSGGRMAGYVNGRICDYLYKRAFTAPTAGSRLLELGCGGSSMLPHFAARFGFQVSGIDYSELGCEQARQALSKAGVSGEIACADFFAPPPELLDSFDVVWSNGVIEHFADTASVVRHFAQFLKPGGLLLTVVPNMAGAVGLLLSKLNRRVYDMHVILDREAVRRAHVAAGLTVTDCDYLMTVNFGVCYCLDGIRIGSIEYYLKKSAIFGLLAGTLAVWTLEDMAGKRLPSNSFSSPYIVCAARRGATSSSLDAAPTSIARAKPVMGVK
jgi:2-polyprenyl-3-methyl-5-hydroxy-6-metoxy-1,4-benzoquinol methylase